MKKKLDRLLRSRALAGAFAAAATIMSASAFAQSTSINSTSQIRPSGPYTPVPQQPFTGNASHRVVVSNDLGMHCADLDSRISSILPPFNVLHAQVLQKGATPQLLDDRAVSVMYSAAANAKDPALATAPVLAPNGAVFKTNFWKALTGYKGFYPTGALWVYFAPGVGRVDIGLPVPDAYELFLGGKTLVINQQTMPSVTSFVIDPTTHAPTSVTDQPYVANAPQPFKAFEKSWPMFTGLPFGYVASNTNWFAAEGIPISTFDDAGRENPYPLMRVQAKLNSTGAVVASLDTVVPVSGETNCKTCHLPGLATTDPKNATKKLTSPYSAADDPMKRRVPQWVSEEWAADINMLTLHDIKHKTSLVTAIDPTTGVATKPVVCQTCHYTPALDLLQKGPQKDHGLTQTTHASMSRVMHSLHGVVNGVSLFPAMPAPGASRSASIAQNILEESCYQCHPGKRTQCLRGVMTTKAGSVCQDCHGQMAQVGADFSANAPNFVVKADFYTNASTPRVPWLNEPNCGSCHTGDAVSNLASSAGVIKAPDNIRLLQAFRSTDAKATPIVPTNNRFAEPRVTTTGGASNPQLFRLSVDSHGGVFCQGCHGATHAEWPVRNANSNDNVAANQLQGHAGTVMECSTCHTGTSMPATVNGPHGMHPVGNNGFSAAWVRGHEDFVERNGTASCKACHGVNGEGTVLAKAAIDRPGLKCERGSLCSTETTVTLPAGTQVSCTLCHENKIR